MIRNKKPYSILSIVFLLIFIIFNTAQSSSNFSESRIQQACYNFIKSTCGDDVEITFLSKIAPISFRQEGVTARISQGSQCQSISKLLIEFFWNGEIIKTTEISVKIRIFRIVPVAVNTIQKGRRLSLEDITLARADVTNINPSDIPNEDELLGAQVARTIPKGGILLKSNFHSGIVIKKGDKVQVEVNVGAVKIRTTGYSMQDAKAGDVVKFKYENNVLTGIAAPDGSIIVKSIENFTQR